MNVPRCAGVDRSVKKKRGLRFKTCTRKTRDNQLLNWECQTKASIGGRGLTEVGAQPPDPVEPKKKPLTGGRAGGR